MHRKQKPRNPFYLLLVVVGAIFAVTAFAYGIMALVDVRASAQLTGPGTHPLLDWLRRHGDMTMLSELGVLAALTAAAIGTDNYWDRRSENPQHSQLMD